MELEVNLHICDSCKDELFDEGYYTEDGRFYCPECLSHFDEDYEDELNQAKENFTCKCHNCEEPISAKEGFYVKNAFGKIRWWKNKNITFYCPECCKSIDNMYEHAENEEIDNYIESLL